MPEISVIVPVYKAEAYLKDCVESILSQTFDDYEIILVDDGSPDNCGSLCDAYARQHPEIRVIHQENQGQSAARNHGMAVAKGQWICFTDSDDLIHPRTLELLHGAVMETGAGISLCGMLEAEDLPEGFMNCKNAEFEKYTMDEQTLLQLHDRGDYPGWVACAKLIRRDLIEYYPFREGRVYEDNEAVCRWICRAGCLAKTEEALYFYRRNPESTTKSTFNRKHLDYLWALESIMEHYGAMGFRQLRQRFLQRYVEEVAGCCNGVRYELKQPGLVKAIRKQTRSFLRREKISLTKAQFERMLEAMYPEWMWLYWPVSGAVFTLRQQGIGAVLKKIRKQREKGR